MVAVGDKNESILQLTARLNRAREMLEPMKLNYCFNNLLLVMQFDARSVHKYSKKI